MRLSGGIMLIVCLDTSPDVRHHLRVKNGL
jgi:hypothetical protein